MSLFVRVKADHEAAAANAALAVGYLGHWVYDMQERTFYVATHCNRVLPQKQRFSLALLMLVMFPFLAHSAVMTCFVHSAELAST